MTGIRILEIAHDHPAWTPGGSEIVAHDLTRALDARPAVSARFLAAATSLHRPDAEPGALQALGEDYILRTGAYDRFTMLRLDGNAWLAGLGQVLETLRPDVVHLHGLDRIGAEILPALRRLAPRCRIVLTLHDYQLICTNDGLMLTTRDGARCGGAAADKCHRCFPEIATARHALRRAHLMALLEFVDVMIAPSAFLRDRFVEWGIAPERIRILPNAVVTEAGAAPVSGGDAPRTRFAFFGNVSRRKGTLVLLDAAARLRAEGSRARVDLHGGLGWADEAFRTDFAARLEAAGPIAQHLGPYARTDVQKLMRQTDWVVVPSIWWENAPLVMIEARAAGRPVICSDIGGMAEMVADGIDGLHVPAGNAAALADKIAQAAGDADLWSRLAGNVKAPPSHASFVDAHLRIFEQALGREIA